MNIPRRFISEPEGYREIPALIPAGRPKTHMINPEWSNAPLELLEDGRVIPTLEADKLKRNFR